MPRLNDPGFWQPYLPQLRREFADLTMDILIAGGDDGAAAVRAGSVLIDWDTFNEDAIAWLDMYLGAGGAGLLPANAYPWAWALNESTRLGVAREIDRWIRAGAPLPELERRLLPFFDQRRARRIAVTEVTRIYASGNVMAWKASGVVGGKRWQTARDEVVCFPKWTMVETERGPVAIQDIRPGAKVMTRQGLREVVAVSSRAYAGPMTRLSARGRRIVATADHPVWDSEQGWLPIGEFKRGHYVETIGKQIGHVDSVFNFILGQAQHSPAVTGQERILTRVPFAVSMPVSAIHLQSDAAIWQGKVNGVAAYPRFLPVVDTQIVKGKADTLFKSVLALKTTIARKRTELPVSVTGHAAKLAPAGSAVFDDRRSTTLFRTEMPVKMLFGREDFTATLASNVLGFSQTTGAATDGVAVGRGRRNSKGLAALGTYLFNHDRRAVSLVTGRRAVLALALALHAFQPRAASLTGWIADRLALGKAVTGLRAKGAAVLAALGFSETLTALLANVGKRHVAPLATDLTVLYHRLSGSAITVYDIQVEGEPEFYANGILVHNCPICGRLHNTFVELDRGWEFNAGALAADPALARALRAPLTVIVPPAHVGCRCWVQPVVYEALTPDEVAAGRFDPAAGGAGGGI